MVDDFETDAAIDKYHEGYDMRRRGEPRPACPVQASGWDDRDRASKVRVVMPARPEGYFHAPIDTFN